MAVILLFHISSENPDKALLKNSYCLWPKCAYAEQRAQHWKNEATKSLEEAMRAREEAQKAQIAVENAREQITAIKNTDVLQLQRESIREMMAQFAKFQTKTEEPSDTTLFLKRQSLIELPDFNGANHLWPQFKRIFEDTTREGLFSDMENILRLTKHLKDEAYNHVCALFSQAENIGLIMTRLETRFGNTELVFEGLLEKIYDCKSLREESPKTIIDFANAIESLIVNTKLIGCPHYLRDYRLPKTLAARLPHSLHQSWMKRILDAQKAATPEKPYTAPTVEDFNQWLEPHKDLAILMESEKPVGYSDTKKYERINGHFHTLPRPAKFFKKCFACNGKHNTSDCITFKNMSVERRRSLVVRCKICFTCCNYSNHEAKNCKFPVKCQREGCYGKHHPLLHVENRRPRKNPQHQDKQGEQEQFRNSSESIYCPRVVNNSIRYQVMPVVLQNGSKEMEVLAFLDLGSSTTLLLDDTKRKLNLKGKHDPYALAWTNDEVQSEPNGEEVTLKIKGEHGQRLVLKGVRTIRKLSLPHQALDVQDVKSKYSHLRDIDLKGYETGVPTLLIGLPHAHLIQSLEHRRGKFGEPVADRNRLGWVLYGKDYQEHKQPARLLHIRETKISNTSTNEDSVGSKLSAMKRKKSSKKSKRTDKVQDQSDAQKQYQIDVGENSQSIKKFNMEHVTQFALNKTTHKTTATNHDSFTSLEVNKPGRKETRKILQRKIAWMLVCKTRKKQSKEISLLDR